jgi:pyruvate-formate lyase
MHDRYDYEKTQMALHDTFVRRFLSFGISGLNVVPSSMPASPPSATSTAARLTLRWASKRHTYTSY